MIRSPGVPSPSRRFHRKFATIIESGVDCEALATQFLARFPFVRPDDELWARINRRPQFRSCDFHYSALGHQVLAENLAPLIRSWLAW